MSSRQLELDQRNESAVNHWSHKYFSRPRPRFPLPWPWVMRSFYENDLTRKRLKARVWLRDRPKPVVVPIHKCYYSGCERTDFNHVHFLGGVLEGNPTGARRFHLRSVK